MLPSPKIDVTETTNVKEFNNFPGAQIAMDTRTRLSLLHTLHRNDEVEGGRRMEAEANFKITVFF